MTEDLLDDLMLKDDADDAHLAATAGTDEWVNFVNSSYQACPRLSPGPALGIGKPVVWRRPRF